MGAIRTFFQSAGLFTPWMALCLLLVPVIILLYLLKLKRQEVVISATLLWRRSIEDLTANAPFQKLRRNLLMFLQILFVLLATLFLLRPYIHAGVLEGNNYILLVDNSASMQTVDVEGRSRLEEARMQAEKLIESMAGEDSMTVIAFSRRAEIIENKTSDKKALLGALRRIEARDLTTDLTDALAIALSLSRSMEKPSIKILSDGVFPDVTGVEIETNHSIEFIQVGREGNDDNVAVTEINTGRTLDSHLDYEVFVGLHNFSSTAKTVILELLHEGDLLDAKQVTLAPRGREGVVFAKFGNVEGPLEVHLSPPGGSGSVDSLGVDNRAWTYIPERRESEVVLVTGGNYVLEKVLAVDPKIKLSVVDVHEYEPDRKADLVVFDSFSPENLPPGRYLFWNAIPRLADITAAGTEELPVVVDWNRTHPVTRFVGFDNLSVEKCTLIGLQNPSESLAQSHSGTLIAALDREGYRAVCIGFDVFQSNWPLLFSFPIFLSNSVEWLLGTQTSKGVSQFQSGESIPIPLPGDEPETRVVNPNAEEFEVPRAASEPVAYFADTSLTGVYEVQGRDGRTDRFVVNLLSPEESDVLPRQEVGLGNQSVSSVVQAVRQNVELWKPVAVVALLLLMLEWYIYTRRVWI